MRLFVGDGRILFVRECGAGREGGSAARLRLANALGVVIMRGISL